MKIPGGDPFWSMADTAMCVPSGDQSGANSAPSPVVICESPVPSAFTVKM